VKSADRNSPPLDRKINAVSSPVTPIARLFPDDVYVELIACIPDVTLVDSAPSEPTCTAENAKILVERLATILWESAPDGLVEIDSASWRAFTGQSYDDWKGYGWLTALHPDDRIPTVEKWRDTVRDERPVEAEYRLRRLDGNYQWMRIHAVPARDEDGQIRKWFGMNIEIAEHPYQAQIGLESSNFASAIRRP